MCLIREDLSRLNYVTLCIKETLRMYTLTPFIGKLSSEDVVVNGYRIPKGIKLHNNMYTCKYVCMCACMHGCMYVSKQKHPGVKKGVAKNFNALIVHYNSTCCGITVAR